MKAALLTAGVLQIALALLHLAFPARFGWKQEAARMSRLNEQIFHVHTFFVCLTLVLFGIWTMVLLEDLLSARQRALASGIAVFWLARLYSQWFVYDPVLWRGKKFETAMHILFTILWIFLTGTYGAAACAGLF